MRYKTDWVDVWLKPLCTIGVWILVFVVAQNFADWLIPQDDSDHPDGTRSGIKICIDHRTGCHYIGSLWGCSYPRLDQHGKQICERGHENTNR